MVTKTSWENIATLHNGEDQAGTVGSNREAWTQLQEVVLVLDVRPEMCVYYHTLYSATRHGYI